jgi:hypothetical protein
MDYGNFLDSCTSSRDGAFWSSSNQELVTEARRAGCCDRLVVGSIKASAPKDERQIRKSNHHYGGNRCYRSVCCCVGDAADKARAGSDQVNVVAFHLSNLLLMRAHRPAPLGLRQAEDQRNQAQGGDRHHPKSVDEGKRLRLCHQAGIDTPVGLMDGIGRA